MGDLKLVQEEVTGLVRIKENSQFNNIKAEKVIIAENITARLYGKVNDVVLKKGSRLYLHGIISGSLQNEGGEIHVFSGDN